MAKVEMSLKRSIAATVFPRYSSFIDKMNWNARWVQTIKALEPIPTFPYRDHLHTFINDTYFNKGADPVDYLEFGVYEGESIGWWTKINTNPASQLFGFDSFEGLPEDWVNNKPKGTFSTNKKVPDIKDSRVQWVVGWFQHTVPGFLASFEPKHRLLIHNDSDLFSSTLYCLTVLNPIIKPGTIVIFDEFDAVVDEFKALTSYASAFMRTYKILAATNGFGQIAIEIL